MRLLKLTGPGQFSLTEVSRHNTPPYAILSHTWTDDQEVSFKDLMKGKGKDKAGYRKISFCSEQAAKDNLQYFWVDTCCIDKSNNTELTEAINSMFRWYRDAARCYTYLADVSTPGYDTDPQSCQSIREASFRESRWFTRGWTLQELIAPASVEFFSSEGKRLGDKKSLQQQIYEITGIPIQALQGNPFSYFSITERMAWATKRQTTKEEDEAYCLLGICEVSMPLVYGEGRQKALTRLLREVSESSTEINNIKDQEDSLESQPTPSSTVPFRRDADFVDRKTVLDQIHQKCAIAGSWTALVGLGGVGKSQLAIEYAYQSQERSPNTWVFWVHASNAARFEQSYRDIADCVRIPDRRNPTTNIFKLVHDWLRGSKGQWLIILDNVDDARFLLEAQPYNSGSSSKPLREYLPQSQNGSILITTRSKEAALKLVEPCDIIAVDPMDEKHALALFGKKLGVQEDSNDIAELVAALEFMPLAIVQAAAYISKRAPRSSVRQYFEQFQKSDRKRTNLLDHEGGQLRRDREAKNSIIITWQISFNYIYQTRPSAANLLSLMSFFDCQGIPEVLLQNRTKHRNYFQDREEHNQEYDDDDDDFSSQSSQSDEFEEDVAALRNFSFISINADGTTFEMHRLVQLATRKWLEAHGQLEKWKQQFVRKLCKEFPTGEYENWAVCQALFPHAKSAAAQKPKEQDPLRDWASILYKAAWYAWSIGNGVEAEEMSVQAMKARRKILGREDEDTLWSMAMVGLAYELRGQWDRAEELEVQVMEICKKKLGADHLSTLTSMANLAATYWNQDRWEAAEELEVQVMEMSKKKLGADHPDTLNSMANLAATYWNQDRWEAAEELEVQVMEMSKKKLGADHPSTLISMANLAATYRDQGRWEAAEELEVQVMETRKKKLGANHPNTLSSMANLAFTWREQGRDSEAVSLMRECVRLRQRILGSDHPHFISSSNSLARWEAERAKR